MSGKLRPRPGILQVQAYVPGRSMAAGHKRVVKLSSNESPFGPSPKAVKTFRDAAQELGRYPDGDATALREALAAEHKIAAANIVCSAGSDEMISLLTQGFLGPGDEAIYPQYGFLIHKIAIQVSGATLVTVPEKDYRVDVEAVLDAVTDKTRAVFIANPNNPTGTYLNGSELQKLRDGLPEQVLLVIDSAYAEYVSAADYDPGTGLVSASGNTVMMRTFSKIYGLAAARIGWAYCPPDVAQILNTIRPPFNLSGPAMAAAIAAIADREHVIRSAEHNKHWRAWLRDELASLGLGVPDSAGNFVLIHFPEDRPGKTAQAADLFLLEKG
ncbi:MAG TPA: histidinol-phosphate transaminase, partial [Hyphomicrobiales bacterium]|nr:histidinol-phosphate transaminase [Hyphomicrobiales bacterium]